MKGAGDTWRTQLENLGKAIYSEFKVSIVFTVKISFRSARDDIRSLGHLSVFVVGIDQRSVYNK